ncbi:MAG: galactokinase family protein [Eubacteriales bacterium]|nr:galactokinase family protein [Eubacteriales bacterium]
MIPFNQAELSLRTGSMDTTICNVYGCSGGSEQLDEYRSRLLHVVDGFRTTFGRKDMIELFSAPGRTELGGNHTDHQHGNVLAASVNLDIVSCAAPNDSMIVRIQSEGYPLDEIDLSDLTPHPEETNRTAALIRGVAAAAYKQGFEVRGFDAYMTSNVLSGSGLSSSAAYETIIGVMVNRFFCEGKLTAIDIAKIGQYAEKIYFGKPCGLMDQMASSVGGIIAIDFDQESDPVVRRISYDMQASEHSLCIIDTGGDHAELTSEYAAIPREMGEIAAAFGKEVLREVDEAEFLRSVPSLRRQLGDRAVLRAMHFFAENRRAVAEKEALERGNFERFRQLVRRSGRSSAMYLQNVYTGVNPEKQDMSIALALAENILGDRGAVRVHGGGFAGTIQAFVPNDMLPYFKTTIESVLGKDMCHVLTIRPAGGVVLMS